MDEPTVSSAYVRSAFRLLDEATPGGDACSGQAKAVADALEHLEKARDHVRVCEELEAAAKEIVQQTRQQWHDAVAAHDAAVDNLRSAKADLKAAEDHENAARRQRDLLVREGRRLEREHRRAEADLQACTTDDCRQRIRAELAAIDADIASNNEAEAQAEADADAALLRVENAKNELNAAVDRERQTDETRRAAEESYHHQVAIHRKAQERTKEARAGVREARRDYRAAVKALRQCRKQHKAHHCGERGGPGIRTPRGKCMSWEELERDS